MRRGWLWVIIGSLTALFVVLFIVLYLLGGAEQAPLERIRDIAIIFLALASILVVLLLGALVGIGIWLGLLLRDHLIPLLSAATDTVTRAKGVVQFSGELVARPLVRTYRRITELRALVRTLTKGH